MPVLGKQAQRSDSHFLYIPMSRYIIMSLVTFGIYSAYWQFKNWEYLKNRDNLKIHPFWRGVFAIFFCHELLRKIHDDPILNNNETAQFNHSFLATGWVLIVIIQYIFSRLFSDFSNGSILLIFLALLVIELSFFIPVQRYINEVNEKIYPAPDYYPWSIGHFILIGLVIAIFMIGFFGANSSSSEPVKTTEITYQPMQTIATLQTIVPLKTIAPAPILIDSSGKSGWVRYTNPNDQFSIYRPSDWSINSIDKSEVMDKSDSLYSQMMNDYVYIFTPNAKGFILIYGVDFTGTLYSIFDDKEKTQISNEFYDEFVKGLKSAETEELKITSLEKDGNYYVINGNPARRVTIYSQINGQSLNGDAYVIAHGNTYYVEAYFAMAGSTQSDASTASNIMRTFTTNA